MYDGENRENWDYEHFDNAERGTVWWTLWKPCKPCIRTTRVQLYDGENSENYEPLAPDN